MAPVNHHWIFVFGVLGNIISFMVYLAPVPTFWRIYKKKSTEGFESLPYICAIFSAMLWIYYALLKTNSFLLITINCFGCVIETIYVAIFIAYASKQAKTSAFKVIVLLNLLGFSSIILACSYLAKPSVRVEILGWICVAFCVVVFAAPLTAIRTVIRTKSVEFMPFPLSLALSLSAVTWFMYGMLQRDMYVVLPNILGFSFGVAQMVLYGIYRNYPKPESKDIEKELHDKIPCDTHVKLTAEVHPVSSSPVTDDSAEDEARGERKKDVMLHEVQVSCMDSCVANNVNVAEPVSTGVVAAGATTKLVDCVV
ncbi:hypothetical protein V2J09_016964 [Rumex salicifolius]